MFETGEGFFVIRILEMRARTPAYPAGEDARVPAGEDARVPGGEDARVPGEGGRPRSPGFNYAMLISSVR